ncbi:tetratricopeptide repeat protein [Desulfobulbus propionicus]
MRATIFHFRNYHVLLIFLIVVFISYHNSLTASWHFDDLQNIVENQKLHLTSLDTGSLIQVLFAHPREEGRLFRPVAYLSFALNWYFGADHVLGYHLVNILLHIGTAFLLYLTNLSLLDAPALREQQQSTRNKHLIALLAALLWALNPIHTQAVTYIVQRMAGLATFFSLATLLCYLLGRRLGNKRTQWAWWLAALICFVLALGSKENSITLPMVLLLVEWIFFRSLARITGRHLLVGAGLLVVAGFAIYLLTNGNPLGSIMGYDHRSFTLGQRLLTESRIMLFYLSLLLFPAPWRLSLDHDILLSTSILQPPTTALSIAFLAGLTCWALWKRKSWPIASFAILFFLLNHTIESTVFPLELIFEHRNYLPSLFLFLPLAVAVVDFHQSDRLRTVPVVRHTVAAVVVLLLCTLGAATYSRNAVWRTEQSLWEDSLAKAPGQSRPYINLAHTYQKLGRSDETFELCRLSLTKDSPTPTKDRMRAYNNMGNISMERNHFSEAVGYYRQALLAYSNEPSRYFLHKALLADGQPQKAHEELAALIDKHPDDNELKISMALVLAGQQQYPEAVNMLRGMLQRTGINGYERSSALICLGSLLSRQGEYKDAEQQFREAMAISEPRLPLLCVIGNHLQQGNQTAASTQLQEMLKHFRSNDLEQLVRSANRQNILFPVATDELNAFIQAQATILKTSDVKAP